MFHITKLFTDIEKPIGERKSNADKLFSYTKLKHDQIKDHYAGSGKIGVTSDYVKSNELKVSLRIFRYGLYLIIYS